MPKSHSMLASVISVGRVRRFEANASQMIKSIIITATREITEPIEDTVFHRA